MPPDVTCLQPNYLMGNLVILFYGFTSCPIANQGWAEMFVGTWYQGNKLWIVPKSFQNNCISTKKKVNEKRKVNNSWQFKELCITLHLREILKTKKKIKLFLTVMKEVCF